jgi:hypothetical protein
MTKPFEIKELMNGMVGWLDNLRRRKIHRRKEEEYTGKRHI